MIRAKEQATHDIKPGWPGFGQQIWPFRELICICQRHPEPVGNGGRSLPSSHLVLETKNLDHAGKT
jgi:hypothetical protein